MRMEPLFRSVQQKLDRLNTVLQENIAGARLVKAFVRADYESERFEQANEDFTNRTVRVMQFMSTMGPVLTIFVNIGMVIVIWAGGLQAIDGRVTVGQIVAFTNYLLTTMGPLTMMTMLSNVWANGIASAQRINEVLDTVPEVQDAAGCAAFARQCARQGRLRECLFSLQRRRRGAGWSGPDRRAGPDGRHPGRDRGGQNQPGQPDPALL